MTVRILYTRVRMPVRIPGLLKETNYQQPTLQNQSILFVIANPYCYLKYYLVSDQDTESRPDFHTLAKDRQGFAIS